MEENNKSQGVKLPSQEIDYFKIAKIFLSRWYWIAGSMVCCMIIANVYLWYTPKVYSTGGTMKFEEKKSEISDLSGGVSSVAVDRTQSRIQSEIIILQSNALILNAIKELDYRFSFFVKGRFVNRTNELYPQKPLNIQLVRFDSLNFYHEMIMFQPVNDASFSLKYMDGAKEVQKIYKYNVPFTIGPTAFSITHPSYISNTSVFLFKLNAPDDFIGRVKGGLRIGETAKNSNTIGLQESDYNPKFAADILNALMKEYLIYDSNQKRLSDAQMIEFIDNQLDFLANQVKGSSNSIASYKNKSQIMDINSASRDAVTAFQNLQGQLSMLKFQLLSLDQVKDQIIRNKNNFHLNPVMGSDVDSVLADYVPSLNTLLLEKSNLEKTFTHNSQYITDIDNQILGVKNNALNTINASENLIHSKIKYLNDQLTPVNQKISALPSAEREMVSLQRDFEIDDKVYSFLSEKKIDAQISSAGVTPGATIIDTAQPNFSPISPDEKEIHETAIFFGLAIGFGLIFLIRALNPYIYDKETIESLTTIPILGIIRKFPYPIDEDSTQILAISKPRSVFAESVRSVRTNLSFLAAEKASKVICITSEVAGEGKSFVAVNLASTLSIIDKKVILIAADLRRSKIHKTFNVPNNKGLSNYLALQCSIDEIILHSSYDALDFIISGPVPPNPSELLHTERMKDLLEQLRGKYDVIMFDTAPIGLVSDAIPLIRMSDINIFVIRSGRSKFYAATVPQRIAQEYQLDNTSIVLNAFSEDLLHSRYYTTKFTGEQYGSRYYYYSDYTGYESSGYYLDSEKSRWWDFKKWFKK